MPFFIFLFIAAVIVFSITAKKKAMTAASERDARIKKQLEELSSEGSDHGPDPVKEAEAAARREELKRRLEENLRRRETERAAAQAATAQAAAAQAAAAQAKSSERRPLEKRTMETALKKEKPVVVHADDDCGGGSIHDGYHEGVTQFQSRPSASVAGNLGRRLADEDERAEKEAAAAENARKALQRIAKLPPLAQGMVYSEILGKPKSEIA